MRDLRKEIRVGWSNKWVGNLRDKKAHDPVVAVKLRIRQDNERDTNPIVEVRIGACRFSKHACFLAMRLVFFFINFSSKSVNIWPGLSTISSIVMYVLSVTSINCGALFSWYSREEMWKPRI